MFGILSPQNGWKVIDKKCCRWHLQKKKPSFPNCAEILKTHLSSFGFVLGIIPAIHTHPKLSWMRAAPGRIYIHLHMAGFDQDEIHNFFRPFYWHPKNLASLTPLASNIYMCTYIIHMYIIYIIYIPMYMSCIYITYTHFVSWKMKDPKFHQWSHVFFHHHKSGMLTIRPWSLPANPEKQPNHQHSSP